MNRRDFMKQTACGVAAVALPTGQAVAAQAKQPTKLWSFVMPSYPGQECPDIWSIFAESAEEAIAIAVDEIREDHECDCDGDDCHGCFDDGVIESVVPIAESEDSVFRVDIRDGGPEDWIVDLKEMFPKDPQFEEIDDIEWISLPVFKWRRFVASRCRVDQWRVKELHSSSYWC